MEGAGGRILRVGCVVSGASEEGQFVEWVVGCAESKRAEAAGSKVAGPCGSACGFSR